MLHRQFRFVGGF